MIPFPSKKYQIIYADPPWSYPGGLKNARGIARQHYETMNTEDICNLPVAEVAGGGLASSFGQLSQRSRMRSKLWRRGDLGTSARRLCGSRKIRRAGRTTGAWGTTHGPTPRCACWASPRSSRPPSGSRATGYIRSWRPRLQATAESRRRCGGGSWSCWATFHALSFSPVSGRRAGTPGEMRFKGAAV